MSDPDQDGHIYMFSGRCPVDWVASVTVAMGAKDLAVVGHREAGLDQHGIASLDRAIDTVLERRDAQLAFW